LDRIKAYSQKEWVFLFFNDLRTRDTPFGKPFDKLKAVSVGEGVYIYDWKTGKSLSGDLSIQLGCYALYAMEKWNAPPESLNIIEYNLSFDKSNWFSVSQEEIKGIKGYINGSIKDMQSLLADVSNNFPMEEDRFSKIEDEHIISRCNYRKLCIK
jgi:hypothetical protein